MVKVRKLHLEVVNGEVQYVYRDVVPKTIEQRIAELQHTIEGLEYMQGEKVGMYITERKLRQAKAELKQLTEEV